VSEALAAIERLPDGRLRVAGELVFEQAAQVLARGSMLYEGGRADVEVDLSGLRQVDSATLAVLLAWAARAARAGVALRFTGAPATLLALARLCDAAPLLGIEA
jgi:phospholipid transport system transporter-binding protein